MSEQGPVEPRPTTSATPAAARSRLPQVLLGTAMATVVLAGTAAVALSQGDAASSRPVAARAPVPVPTATVSGVTAGRVAWDAPLSIAVQRGTLTAVSAEAPTGASLPGVVTPTGWRSTATLLPDATYTLVASVRDSADEVHALPLRAVSTKADTLVKGALSPGDDSVVGVGRPVQLTLDHDVTDAAARKAVVARLSVSASPTVAGAWRWMDDRTVHYRPATFWKTGTKVAVTADLQRLKLPGGAWGSGARTSTFTVGDALISTVDVQAHTMTVRRNGKVLRVMPASMGRPEFPTRNGTFLVLEKHRRRVMDSATVDLPPGTPAYRTAVEHAVRITNSGTFTHGAPWSVRAQGVRNVSHGCINLSPSDAAWYFGQTTRGDVVKVVGSTQGPNSSDAGSRDWNMTFAEWLRA